MRTRPHHNNSGRRQAQRGRPEAQMRRLATRLRVRYGAVRRPEAPRSEDDAHGQREIMP